MTRIPEDREHEAPKVSHLLRGDAYMGTLQIAVFQYVTVAVFIFLLAGYWDLPGGFVEEGEHPLDALRRELREETGLEIEPGAFLGIWVDTYSEDGSGPATLNLYWTARVAGTGEGQAADDVSELRWFDPGDLPPADEFAFHTAGVVSAWRQEHA